MGQGRKDGIKFLNLNLGTLVGAREAAFYPGLPVLLQKSTLILEQI